MTPDTATLDQALLAAHAAGAAELLPGLYARAAGMKADTGDIDAAAFYLTQAYVYALEAGDDAATNHHERLRGWGREE